MHDYTVELRIFSSKKDFCINQITNDLGIKPNNIRHKGERRSTNSVFSYSLWGYVVKSNTNNKWKSLEKALDALLKIFLPLKKNIQKYAFKYDVIIWCGHFTSSFDGGPILSPKILKKLSLLGIKLFIDTYYYKEK